MPRHVSTSAQDQTDVMKERACESSDLRLPASWIGPASAENWQGYL
jgi:hypothetical protein